MGTKLNPPKGWKRRMKKHGETIGVGKTGTGTGTLLGEGRNPIDN